MAGSLDLDDCPRTLVYRKIVEFLRNDPTLRRVIRPPSLRTWDGKPTDSADFGAATAPCLRLTPINGPDAWVYPSAFAGDLLLNCEVLVTGTNVDDLFNLWWAISRAIYPKDPAKRMANIQALQLAGAKNGLVEFSQPAFDPDPKDNFLWGTGQLRVSILSQLNT